jgi:lipoyl(octanoyl) transferase
MPSATELHLVRLDDAPIPYGGALALQYELRERLLEGERPEDCAGYLVALEHPPVVTLGKRGEHTDLVARERLREHGIEVFEIERGGEATYHGPGQLVLYPIVELERLELGVVDVVRGLAGGIADVFERFDVPSGYDSDHPGVWTDDEPHRKLASVGMRVRKGITTHGAAVNLTNDMEPFSMIVPCGMPDAPMGRLADRVDVPDDAIAPERLADPLIEHVAELTETEIVEADLELPPSSNWVEPVEV